MMERKTLSSDQTAPLKPKPGLSGPPGLGQKRFRFHRGFRWSSIVPSCASEFALLNQARLDRRDPPLGLRQRFGACMHGMGAQDKVVIMRHSRAKNELSDGLGLSLDQGAQP